MKLIIGLGNPGKEYDGTRHNVGFRVIDRLALEHGVLVNKMKHRALTGEGPVAGGRAALVKPQTYMNNSGEAVAALMRFYKLTAADIILVYDDASLPVGKLRVRREGSAGGHNGVKSVIWALKTDAFDRVKVGIGEKPERWDLADYVLSRFNKDETETMEAAVIRAAEAAEYILQGGAEAAMNRFNG